MLKKFLYKLRTDLKQLFNFPVCHWANDKSIDYSSYWKVRSKKGKDDLALSDWQKERADIVLGFVKKDSSVIDLGCGNGAVLNYFKNKANIKGIGVDVSSQVLEKAKQNGLQTVVADISNSEELKKLPKADFVTAFELLEHVPSSENLLHNLEKIAKQGIVFSVPNTGYYLHRLRLLFGRFPLQWIAHPGEHLRFWTKKDMCSWLGQQNFNYELNMYQGLPGLKKIWSSLFAQGMLIYIKLDKND